jgi:carboxymethylenebutenolidase
MSEEAVFFADRLAAEGYYALAPDLFRNTAAKGMNILWNMVNVIGTPQSRMDKDSDAALTYLRSLSEVDTDKIISGPGFCFGGSQSLIFGSRYKSAAVVTLYGTYISELDDESSEAWGELPKGGPILGLYGKEDTRPGVDDVETFRTALQKKDMIATLSVYDDVGHAFVNPEAHKDAKAKGHKQAVAGWAQVVGFFHDNLNSSSTLLASDAVNSHKISVEPAGVAMQRYQVPFVAGLKHRVFCALKCGYDMFTMDEGHNHKTVK